MLTAAVSEDMSAIVPLLSVAVLLKIRTAAVLRHESQFRVNSNNSVLKTVSTEEKPLQFNV